MIDTTMVVLYSTLCSYVQGGPKSKLMSNYEKVVLIRIKASQKD